MAVMFLFSNDCLLTYSLYVEIDQISDPLLIPMESDRAAQILQKQFHDSREAFTRIEESSDTLKLHCTLAGLTLSKSQSQRIQSDTPTIEH